MKMLGTAKLHGSERMGLTWSEVCNGPSNSSTPGCRIAICAEKVDESRFSGRKDGMLQVHEMLKLESRCC